MQDAGLLRVAQLRAHRHRVERVTRQLPLLLQRRQLVLLLRNLRLFVCRAMAAMMSCWQSTLLLARLRAAQPVFSQSGQWTISPVASTAMARPPTSLQRSLYWRSAAGLAMIMASASICCGMARKCTGPEGEVGVQHGAQTAMRGPRAPPCTSLLHPRGQQCSSNKLACSPKDVGPQF